MRIYFVRHGESEANVAGEFSNRGVKHPLTARGAAQAEALAAELAPRGIGRIYTSPLQRAAQTAEILARATGAGVEPTEALREWDVGILEGTTGPAGWALHNQVQDDWFIHGRLDSRIEGGESFHDIHARFVPFIEGLLGAAEQTGDIVIVAHGGIYRVMLPVVMPNVDREKILRRPFPNASYALGELRPGGLRCLEWCGEAID